MVLPQDLVNDLLQAEDHMDNVLGNDVGRCCLCPEDGSDRCSWHFCHFLISKYLWMRYRAFICCLLYSWRRLIWMSKMESGLIVMPWVSSRYLASSAFFLSLNV